MFISDNASIKNMDPVAEGSTGISTLIMPTDVVSLDKEVISEEFVMIGMEVVLLPSI